MPAPIHAAQAASGRRPEHEGGIFITTLTASPKTPTQFGGLTLRPPRRPPGITKKHNQHPPPPPPPPPAAPAGTRRRGGGLSPPPPPPPPPPPAGWGGLTLRPEPLRA